MRSPVAHHGRRPSWSRTTSVPGTTDPGPHEQDPHAGIPQVNRRPDRPRAGRGVVVFGGRHPARRRSGQAERLGGRRVRRVGGAPGRLGLRREPRRPSVCGEVRRRRRGRRCRPRGGRRAAGGVGRAAADPGAFGPPGATWRSGHRRLRRCAGSLVARATGRLRPSGHPGATRTDLRRHPADPRQRARRPPGPRPGRRPAAATAGRGGAANARARLMRGPPARDSRSGIVRSTSA